MLSCGGTLKVTIHLNEDRGFDRDVLYGEIFGFLIDQGVSGPTLIRPEVGLGGQHCRWHPGDMVSEQESQPVRLEFMDTKEKVEGLLASLSEFVTDGVIEVHGAMVLKAPMETYKVHVKRGYSALRIRIVRRPKR